MYNQNQVLTQWRILDASTKAESLSLTKGRRLKAQGPEKKARAQGVLGMWSNLAISVNRYFWILV